MLVGLRISKLVIPWVAQVTKPPDQRPRKRDDGR